MPDMNENAETQQEYFGVRTDNKRTLCNALKRIEELEEKLANADYQLEGRDNEIRELETQIEKMKCCENCKHAWCRTSSSSKDKEGKQIFHKWNNTKRKYCDVGKNGKYQCWELAD